MTKELEALKRIRNGSYDDYHSTTFEDIYNDEFEEIKKALTPPTEEEVCKTLSEFMNEPVWFDENNDIRISTQWLVKKINTYGLNFMIVLPPHLITMISRFFERSGDKCTNK